jgi:hypothetical protein
MSTLTRPSSSRLGGYLQAFVGIGGLAATADAAIVNLDLSSITGVNAGVSAGSTTSVSLSTLGPGLTGSLLLANQWGGATSTFTGILVRDGASIAAYPIADYTSPKNFSSNDWIDSTSDFSSGDEYVGFIDTLTSSESPDFGPGSYMGFKSGNGHYGWLEVTWNAANDNFEILSGAYEDVAGVAIQAGAVAAVPEPASMLGTLGLLAGGMFVRRRRMAA